MSETNATPRSSNSTRNSASDRLTVVASHFRSGSRRKVVVTRNLGPDVMPLLLERPELDVRIFSIQMSGWHTERLLQVVAWPEETACDRKWFLDNIVGAEAILVMLSEKVSLFFWLCVAHVLTIK